MTHSHRCPWLLSLLLSALVAACFPTLPPDDDDVGDVLDPDITPDSNETLEDVLPGEDLTPDWSTGPDTDSVTGPGLAFTTLPASVRTGWGRAGSHRVETTEAAALSIVADSCPFEVSLSGDDEVRWQCGETLLDCEATVRAEGAGESITGALGIACVNTPPTVATIHIEPEAPLVGEALTCVVSGYSDAEGDPDESIVAWYRNGAPIADAPTHEAEEVGDVYTCEVTPFDGLAHGTRVTSEPVTVLSRFVDVAVGLEHGCVVHRSGEVWCWGRNAHGQLGNLSQTSTSTPAKVAVLQDAEAVTAGDDHSCALTRAGGVYCWGSNTRGQVGDDTTVQGRLFPVPVAGLSEGVEQLVAGARHTCALKAGEVWCWGDNTHAQLGSHGDVALARAPRKVEGLPAEVSQIDTVADFTCALASGEVWCWSRLQVPHVYREVKIGRDPIDFESRIDAPTRMEAFPPTVTELVVTEGHQICARSPEGVACYGIGNSFGHVANPRFFQEHGTESGSGFQVSPLPRPEDLVKVDAGDAICALWRDGEVRCFGNDGRAQLGSEAPVLFSHLGPALNLPSPAHGLAVGRRFACALAGDDVHCWGSGNEWNLGLQPWWAPREPVVVQGLTAPTHLTLGSHHTCALTSDNDLFCWGRNDILQLGDYSNSSANRPRHITDGVTDVNAHEQVTLILKGGRVTGFGGTFDDLAAFPWLDYGSGSNAPPVPWDFIFFKRDRSILGGLTSHWSACGIQLPDEGDANSNCSLGQRADAIVIHNLRAHDRGRSLLTMRDWELCFHNEYSGVFCSADVFEGFGYSNGSATHISGAPGLLCVVAEARLYCEGRNDVGQVGRGTASTTPRPPGEATALAGQVTDVSVSETYVCAIADGDVWCWGRDNTTGRLGRGTRGSDDLTPLKVEGLGGPAARIYTSRPDGSHTCAVMEDSRVLCWGDNRWGQLGNGEASYRRGPWRVPFAGRASTE